MAKGLRFRKECRYVVRQRDNAAWNSYTPECKIELSQGDLLHYRSSLQADIYCSWGKVYASGQTIGAS